MFKKKKNTNLIFFKFEKKKKKMIYRVHVGRFFGGLSLMNVSCTQLEILCMCLDSAGLLKPGSETDFDGFGLS